jgi:hypothetical protein
MTASSAARTRGALGASLLFAAVLVGCTPGVEPPDADPVPTFTDGPTPSAATLPEGRDIAEWAAVALPEDRPGGQSAVVRASGPVGPDAGAFVDIEQDGGAWDLLLTCQSVDAAPISWRITGAAVATDDWTDQQCTSPGGGGTPSTAMILFEGDGAQLELRASADAVYAAEVRPTSAELD